MIEINVNAKPFRNDQKGYTLENVAHQGIMQHGHTSNLSEMHYGMSNEYRKSSNSRGHEE